MDEAEPVPGQRTTDELQVDRWMKEAADVPESLTNEQLLRSIAAYTKAQAAHASTTAGWVTFIGLVVAVQVVLVLLVVFGAITVETTTGF